MAANDSTMTAEQISRDANAIAAFWVNVAEERDLSHIVGGLKIVEDEAGDLKAVPACDDLQSTFDVTPGDHDETMEAVEFAICIALGKLNAKLTPKLRTGITKIDHRYAYADKQAAKMLGVTTGKGCWCKIGATYDLDRSHVAT